MNLPATGQRIHGVRVRQGQCSDYEGTVDHITWVLGWVPSKNGAEIAPGDGAMIVLHDGSIVWPLIGDTWHPTTIGESR